MAVDPGTKERFIPIYDWMMEETDLTRIEVLLLSAVLNAEFENRRETIISITKHIGIHKRTVQRIVEALQKRGILTYVLDSNIVEKLKKKNCEGVGYGHLICEWCRIFTVLLHKHHYPIPKNKGGSETVNICPNCHSEFHHNAILVASRNNPINQKYRESEIKRTQGCKPIE